MKGKRTIEEINAKCALLMELGFDIGSADYSVYMHDVEFDFSATQGDAKSIMYEALRQMKKEAFAQGKSDAQENIRKALGIGNDSN